MKARYFDGPNGDIRRVEEIPESLREQAEEKRTEMLDAVSMYSDELMEAILEDKVTPELIHDAIRKGTISLDLTPVFLGSAYKNKAVQPLLDAVTRYLPSPVEVTNEALDLSKGEEKVKLSSDVDAPFVALAFKLEEGRFGQLTYIRVYQGQLKKGDTIVNSRTGRDVRVGRLVRMHADEMEDIQDASAGDIVGLFGIDCASGDTFTSDKIRYSMTSMHVPDPVIHLSIKAKDKKAQANLGKALQRFTKEDPTFRARVDEESGETIISGMGELHLDVYVERMKREYSAEVETGAPQVAYREAISRKAEFNHTHKKQTGGSGQYGRVAGYVEPMEEGDFEFVDEIYGGSIPKEFIGSVEKGFKSMIGEGTPDRVPGHRLSRRDQRRRCPRGRLVRQRVSGCGARRIPRGLLVGEAADSRTDHEGVGGRAARIPGSLRAHDHAAPRNHHRNDRGRRVCPSRHRSAAGGNVRVLDRSSLVLPGKGRIHDGVLTLCSGSGRSSRGTG